MGSGTGKTLALLGVFSALFLLVRYLMPLLFPFLLGTALALGAEPMTRFFQKRLGLPRAVSTGISVTMAFFLLALAVLLTAAFFLRELGMLAQVLPDLEQTALSGIHLLEDWALGLAGRLPGSLQVLLTRNVSDFFSGGTRILDRGMTWLLGLAGTVLTHVPDSALSLGTAVISGFMISAKLPKILLWIRRRFPREKLQPLLDALHRVKSAVGGWLFAQLKLSAITWGLLSTGFWILGIGHAPLWALAVAVVDIFPILGTGAVLVPWAAVSLIQGNTAQALGLGGICLVVMLTRSALEPKLLGKHLGLDPLVTLVAMYAGYRIWGIGGMLLAPMLAVTAVQFVVPGNPPTPNS